MNYNAPSLTSMFSWSGDTTAGAKVALIIAAFLLVAAVYAAAILLRKAVRPRYTRLLPLSLQWAFPIFCRICT